MTTGAPIRLRLLQALIALDAAVLLALGASLVAVPTRVAEAFGFIGLAPAMCYLIGLWGCALISLGVGYACSIADPVRNVNWVRAAIVRGALECVFGFSMVSRHILPWEQVAFGTVLAGTINAAYAVLYPRDRPI